MPFISFLLVTYSLSSVLSFNSYDNKEIPKYRQVLSVQTPKYKTLEITATPTNRYYFVPTYNERPTYKKLTVQVGNDSREDFIMNEINNYRVSKGLSKSQTDPNTCSFAKLRAQELVTNFNHDGFTNRINDKTLPYPSFSSITENISINSNYKLVAQKWIESSGHAANIEKDTPFICVGSSGDYYTMQGWKP